MNPIRSGVVLTLVALLGACSAFPARPPDGEWALSRGTEQQQALQGQLSIKLLAFQNLPAKGMSLGFFFTGGPRGGQLDLMTPLGSQVAQVRWNDGGAWLQTEQGERHFETLGELSEQVLGEALPLSALMSWVQGRPAAELPAPTHTAAMSFEQNGWLIDTTDIAAGRVSAQRPAGDRLRGVAVKVRLDR